MVKLTPKSRRFWSAEVTRNSDALDLQKSVFTWKDPRKIALSLKRSAQKSTRRKTTPYASAMSMINFYLNRAGNKMEAGQRIILQQSKDELRRLFKKVDGQKG